MNPLDLLILALATWYVAYIVTKPTLAGPFGILALLRERVSLGGLTHCIICFAPWAAALMLVLWLTPLQPVVYVAAISGGALMLGTYTGATQS